MITAHILHDTILSSSDEAFSLYQKSQWGERKKQGIQYSFIEALALMHEEKLQVLAGKKQVSYHKIHAKVRRHDKNIDTKLAVFLDLRKKGYIVKTALKFGAEFRVYDKGVKPGQDHARWLLFPVKENNTLTWYDFTAKNRVATSTKKRLLIAIVDDENDITYYESNWTRP